VSDDLVVYGGDKSGLAVCTMAGADWKWAAPAIVGKHKFASLNDGKAADLHLKCKFDSMFQQCLALKKQKLQCFHTCICNTCCTSAVSNACGTLAEGPIRHKVNTAPDSLGDL